MSYPLNPPTFSYDYEHEPPPSGFAVNPPPGPPGMSYPPYGMGGGQQGGYPAYPPQPGAPYPPQGGAPGYPPAPGAGFGSAYPPTPGTSPYPTQGMYPPAPGAGFGSAYPPTAGTSPYPQAPYPPQGSSMYPAAPGAYPQGSPYPPQQQGGYAPPPGMGGQQGGYAPPPGMGGQQQGGYAAPPGMGGSPYPAAGGNQYPPAGAPTGRSTSPYPTGAPMQTDGRVSPYPGGAPTGGRSSSPSPYPALSQTSGHETSSGTTAASAPQFQMFTYTERPTVKPISPYDPSGDAQILRKAMKGLGTDESAIIGVLANRTSQQRQEIMMKFQQSYGRDLIKDLKSELSGKFEQVIIALMTPLPIYLARELHHAIAGIGTTESTLIEILCTNSNAWLMAIKQAYHQEFKRTVEDDIKGDTSGDLRRILISMCAACRDESSCDTALANSLAQQLYKAGEGRLGTNEGEFNRILATYSYPLLRCVFEEYKKINGRDFGQAVDSEFSGDIKHGFKAIYMAIQNRSAFFAKEIHDSMAGMGTSDRALIRLVVSRSEIDMVNIKEEYQRMYGKPMEKDIKGDTSGDYKRVLLALSEE